MPPAALGLHLAMVSTPLPTVAADQCFGCRGLLTLLPGEVAVETTSGGLSITGFRHPSDNVGTGLTGRTGVLVGVDPADTNDQVEPIQQGPRDP